MKKNTKTADAKKAVAEVKEAVVQSAPVKKAANCRRFST